MCPRKVRVVWHHKDRPISCREVLEAGLPPRSQSKLAFLAKRNGDDRTARDHVRGAVPVLADVVPHAAVIPVEQDAVEFRGDSFTAPIKKWLQQRRERLGNKG